MKVRESKKVLDQKRLVKEEDDSINGIIYIPRVRCSKYKRLLSE